ncbi:helix-turn-helix domain-containing protein [Skermania piniformis]|uniref:Helix-turn-helix domain-containing protein n=1 Tax=Skermania pinensis TaxID=39122 RepID=A0ABX8S9E4_9ACTN|nr:helix-turn-helix domain-containing protein [Skermania piniformis]QXQ13594.1 helix-turn-helix domain-containing protein [Skermania piniformis]
MDDLFLRTGEVADRLGVSRQHVVDLCTQGKLRYVLIGSHRRIPESAVIAMLAPGRGRYSDGHQQSLALHAAVVAKLIDDPERVLGIAGRNLQRDIDTGSIHDLRYSREWEMLIDQGLPALIEAMLDPSDRGVTLRSCTPFTGVLDSGQVQAIKRIYRKKQVAPGVA